jgi:hypothetical protein
MWYDPQSCISLIAEQWLIKIIKSKSSALKFLSITDGIAASNHTSVE